MGASAVAAVTTGNRLFFGLQAILMAISAGTTALVARSWGAKDYREGARITSASLWIGNGVALVLTIPSVIYAYQIAGIFGLDEKTTRLAADFIRWLSIFNVAFATNLVLGASLRAAGDTRTPLWIGAVTNVINVALVYLLVYGGYGIHPMGVSGAALANGISFVVGAVIFLMMWFRHKLIVDVGGRGSLDPIRVKKLINIGYPAGVEQLVFQIGFVAFLWIVALFGTDAYAAYGVGVSILSISFVVGFGFSIAGATLVGQHLGANDARGADRQGWRATRFAIASMVLLSILIAGFASEIARFLIDDDEVVRLTVNFIYIMALAQPLMAIEFTLGGCLRGAGDTRYPLLTTLVGLVGVRVVLAAIFTLTGLPVEWVYGALIGDYIVKAAMLVRRFKSGKWKQIFSNSEQSLLQGGARDN
jgi:putative MATE family efflux protein